MILAQAQQLEILVVFELRFRLVALKQLEILVVSILRFGLVVLDEQNDCIVRCALSASSKEVHLFLDTTCLAQKMTWWNSKKSISVQSTSNGRNAVHELNVFHDLDASNR